MPFKGKQDADVRLSAPAVAVGHSFEPACQKPSCATPADSAYT